MGDDNTFDKHTAFGIVQSLEFGGTFAVFDECMDDVVFLCVAEELLVRVATCELCKLPNMLQATLHAHFIVLFFQPRTPPAPGPKQKHK